jgi:hypothetical protein
LGRLDCQYRISGLGVSKALFIIAALVCATPALWVWDQLIIQGLIAGVAAVALALVAATLRPSETGFLISTIRPMAVVAAIPPLWILIQVLPLRWLAHPIWTSLATALGQPIIGTISIEPSASVIALGHYLSLVTIAFVSAAVAVDRDRAEWLLFALTGATAAIGFILLADELIRSGADLSPFKMAEAINCAVLGLIVATVTCIRTVERYESRRASPFRSIRLLIATFIASLTALLACVLTLAWVGSRQTSLAAACGFTVLVCVMILRRVRLGAWYVTTIVATTFAIGVLLVAPQRTETSRSFLLAFAVSPGGMSERMLEDAPLVGSGAGTFAALAPIYRQIDETTLDPVASTAAANFAIELGQPILWSFAVAAILLIIILLRASLRRGRDSFYPAMGGACLIATMLLALADAGLLGTSTGLVAATMLGLAIAQSRGRTAAA